MAPFVGNWCALYHRRRVSSLSWRWRRNPLHSGHTTLRSLGMNHRLGIIGGGRAAWAFGSTWKRMGWPIAGVATRSEPRVAQLLGVQPATIDNLARSAELILVAVSDRAIEQVATSIPRTEAIIFHPSGALTSLRG